VQTFDHRLGALSAPRAAAPEDVTLADAAPPLPLLGVDHWRGGASGSW
jgi:hypothetical protein